MEELGVSASQVDRSMFFATSVGIGLCLVQLHDLSALNPSFSSSASFDDKPYSTFINDSNLLAFSISRKHKKKLDNESKPNNNINSLKLHMNDQN